MTEKKEIAVGGQAVIEGVMMRGPAHIATAVRRQNGDIEICKEPFVSVTKKPGLFSKPIIRGFVSLIEMLRIGLKSLTFSAKRAELDMEAPEKKKSARREKTEETMTLIVAFGLAFLLFALLPYKIADWTGIRENPLYFNLYAGVIRVVFFVLYIFIISRLKDIKRVFEYHGAEHKAVHCYEQGKPLTPETVLTFSAKHPRCGTSFIFFVLLVSIVIFAFTDALVAAIIGHAPLIFIRLGYHLLMLPLISGISYEILRFSGKKINHPVVKLMTGPGMALQNMTTQPPDNEQAEIAIVALKAALELPLDDMQNLLWICNNDTAK
ncbi:MAG: DUF1385 domain-containing protein [Candidatus Cloacimonetes bacterium]|nr:DUF1385 domain-containing protein [Candidatus Cloacimonadota bacterium]